MQESYSKQVMSVEEIKNELDDLSKNKDNIIKAIESGVFKEHFFWQINRNQDRGGNIKIKVIACKSTASIPHHTISVQKALKRVA